MIRSREIVPSAEGVIFPFTGQFLANSSVLFFTLRAVAEGFWLKCSNFLASLHRMAALVGVANFLIACAEVLSLVDLLGFFTNLLREKYLLLAIRMCGKIRSFYK